MTQFDLITIGDATIDTFLVIDDASLSCSLDQQNTKLCLNYADKICVTHTAQSVGGNAANVATGAKKIGLKTAIVTELGDDINGHVIFGELEKANVNTDYVKIHKNQTTRYSMVLNYQSERTILSSHVKRTYTLPPLPQTKWMYYTSMGKGFGKVQAKLLRHLKKHPNIKLAHNPGSHQMKEGLKTIKKILPHVDLLLVNKEEARRFVGAKKSIPQMIQSLHDIGPQAVVVTNGTHGSYASNGVNTYFMKPYNIKAKAKTGAGDAYTSGFLSAMVKGKDIPTAMTWGSANAAGVIQEFGAQKGLLTQRKIQALTKKHKTNIPKKT